MVWPKSKLAVCAVGSRVIRVAALPSRLAREIERSSAFSTMDEAGWLTFSWIVSDPVKVRRCASGVRSIR